MINNDENLGHSEKSIDIDKEDLFSYFKSRNFSSKKYKNSMINYGFDIIKSKRNKMKTCYKQKKSIFFNELLHNEIFENSKNECFIEKNENKKKINKENNKKKINELKIKNIFLNSLNDNKLKTAHIRNIESISKIQNENLSYLFDKNTRMNSDSLKKVKNIYTDYMIRKEKILGKLKLLNKKRNPFNLSSEKFKDYQWKTNSNRVRYHNIKSIKSSNSESNLDNKRITCFLKRKTVDNIPLTFPIYLLYKNEFNSNSEKKRVENILNKFICLKTHIDSDPSNSRQMIKEFVLENTNKSIKEISNQNIKNFLDYLNVINFSFDSNKTIKELINIALNYKKDSTKEKVINLKNNMKYNFKLNILNNTVKNKIKVINKSKNCKSNSFPIKKNIIKNLINSNDKILNIKNKDLNIIIKDLENELNQVNDNKVSTDNILGDLNSKNYKKNKSNIKYNFDSSVRIKNICLLNRNLSQRYKELFSQNNKREKKNKSLRKINERMYYNTIKKNPIEEFDMDKIRKNLKLTEFIVLQRARQTLMIQKESQKYSDIMNSKCKKY